jgi:phage shock protein PspC (stress-responsive transcriptional regulator)
MKKTVIVNISGTIFHIDEDAFAKLSSYLEALHGYFDPQTEGKEIVADIESRIAELLQPLLRDSKQSITIEDIETIIATLGKPEDIAGDSPEGGDAKSFASEATEKPKPPRMTTRKIYRDPEHAMLGGVCSGVGAYLGMDVVLVRIVFLLLLFSPYFFFFLHHSHNILSSFFLIVYVVLWIIIPQAVTAAQKLEMRGEEVTIDNLGRSRKEDADPNNAGASKTSGKINHAFQQGVSSVGSGLRAVLNIFRIIFGVVLVFFSAIAIVSIFVILFNSGDIGCRLLGTGELDIIEYLCHINSPTVVVWFISLSLVVVILPLMGLFYAGVKLLLRIEQKSSNWVVLPLFFIWLVALVSLIILTGYQATWFSDRSDSNTEVSLPVRSDNILYLKADSLLTPRNDFWLFGDAALFELGTIDGKKVLYGPITLYVEVSNNSKSSIEIKKEWQGAQFDTDAPANINVPYSLKDSVLTISPVYWTAENVAWRFYHVTITLKIPEGAKVNIDHRLWTVLRYKHHRNRPSVETMTGKTLEKTVDELVVSATHYRNPALKKTIVLKPRRVKWINEKEIESLGNKTVLMDTDTGMVNYGIPVLNFVQTLRDSVWVKVSSLSTVSYPKSRDAKNNKHNSKNYRKESSRGVEYHCQLTDSILYLDPVWYRENAKQAVNGLVKIDVYIPEGTKVFFNKSMQSLLDSTNRHLINHTWRMRDNEFYEVGGKVISTN